MADYAVDYSGAYAHIDGVVDASYTAPGGSAESIHVRRATLTRGDLSGGTFGVSPRDVVFVAWAIAGDATPNGRLTVAGSTYRVIQSSRRGDSAQQRIICRIEN